MQCVTPMVRFYQVLPEHLKNDPDIKPWQTIVPRHEVFYNLKKNENYLSRIQDLNYKFEKEGKDYRYQLIPCKHCWACQLRYAAEWATRIMCETKRHKDNYFITLTYDDANLPMFESCCYTDKDGYKYEYENDGTWMGTLEPKDVNRFINTLRKHYERQGITDIKYFYCGEYGTENGRPHYHMILMGAPLDPKQFYSLKLDDKKFAHWKSKELEKWWNKGFVDVAEVEWANCSYVARYCMKKINNENDPREYAEAGKLKEYVRMSRRPSIGRLYYEQNKDHIYECDEIIQRNVSGKITSLKPPSAWDKLLKEQDPEKYEMIKTSRQAAAERSRLAKAELMKGISDLEQLERAAQKVLQKGKLLPREL